MLDRNISREGGGSPTNLKIWAQRDQREKKNGWISSEGSSSNKKGLQGSDWRRPPYHPQVTQTEPTPAYKKKDGGKGKPGPRGRKTFGLTPRRGHKGRPGNSRGSKVIREKKQENQS